MCLLFLCSYAVFLRYFEVRASTVLALLHVMNRSYPCALLMSCGQGTQFFLLILTAGFQKLRWYCNSCHWNAAAWANGATFKEVERALKLNLSEVSSFLFLCTLAIQLLLWLYLKIDFDHFCIMSTQYNNSHNFSQDIKYLTQFVYHH